MNPENHPTADDEQPLAEHIAEGVAHVVEMMNEGNIAPEVVYPSRGSGSRYYGD